MKGMLCHKPSPALVISFIALIVAMGGTGYAAISLPKNSVGTKQLKKNAVKSSKVKNGSLLADDFAAGQLPAGAQGPVGPRGPQGPAGATGPRGLQGEPGIVGIYMSNDGPESKQALCDAGDVAVGGGGIVSGDGFLTQSQPVPFNVDEFPTGWKVDAKKADGSDAGATAWVVCVF